MGVLAKLGVLLAYLASISLPSGFATAGAVIVVWGELQGEEVDGRAIFSRIRRVFLRLMVLSLCIGIVCAIGGALFFVPGVLGFSFMSFAIPVLVIEEAKVSTALRRGLDLASTRFGTLLGLYALVLLVVIIAAIGIAVLASTVDLPWWIGITAFWGSFVALAPVVVAGTTGAVVCLYRDLREQRGELAARKPVA